MVSSAYLRLLIFFLAILIPAYASSSQASTVLLDSSFCFIHQGGRRDEITFRIKPHTHQRCLEGSNKTLCTPAPRNATETEPALPFECLSCLFIVCGKIARGFDRTKGSMWDLEEINLVALWGRYYWGKNVVEEGWPYFLRKHQPTLGLVPLERQPCSII